MAKFGAAPLDAAFARLIDDADLISRRRAAYCRLAHIGPKRLPERVATTDLYPVLAAMAEKAV